MTRIAAIALCLLMLAPAARAQGPSFVGPPAPVEHPPRPESHVPLPDDGFVTGNDAIAVKCAAPNIGCRGGAFGKDEQERLMAFATLVADGAARAEAWLTELGFPEERLERLNDDSRPLIAIKRTLEDTAGGTNFNAARNEARLIVPIAMADKVFPKEKKAVDPEILRPGLADFGPLASTMSMDALLNLESTLVHELVHARLATRRPLQWLNEAIASAVEDRWQEREGTYFTTDYDMRLNRPFNANGYTPLGSSLGYGKAQFLTFVGKQSGSRDVVSYLGGFGTLTETAVGGMAYLYGGAMPPKHTFAMSFPRFVASLNYLRGPLDTDEDAAEDHVFESIARPARSQAASETRDHDYERHVEIFAADPVLLDDTVIRADMSLLEHDRLMLATVSIPKADRPADLRLVFEHQVPDDNIHRYITVAEGKYDAGYVRVTNAPQNLGGPLEEQNYTLRLRLEPVEFDAPDCLTPGERFEIEAEADGKTVDLDEIDNISFEVSGPATLTDRTVIVTGPGEVTVTAVLESHRTRPPEGVTSPAPHDYPDRRVDFEPVRVSPEGGCTCDPDLFVSMGHPKLYQTVNMFGAALGGGDGPTAPMGGMPGELGTLITGLMGADRPAVRPSEAEMRVSYGAGAAGGLVCADPVAARDGGRGNIVLSFYTPGPSAALGGIEMFGMSVQHNGWEGWPANSKAQVFVELPGVTADDLHAGRSYPARLYALQSTGFAGIFGYHDGEFHDYIPYQEAFEGQTLAVTPIALGGYVTVEEIDDGKLTGTLRLAGRGARFDVIHTIREGSDPPVFEHEGTETEVPLNITARFSLPASEEGERIALRGSFETLRTVDLD